MYSTSIHTYIHISNNTGGLNRGQENSTDNREREAGASLKATRGRECSTEKVERELALRRGSRV